MVPLVLKQWLQHACPLPIDALHEMAGDASFRRYFRLHSGQQSFVVMDASLQLDCCEPYVAIAKTLQQSGIAVPSVIAQDLKKGYMLISDFGDRLYLKELNQNNADRLYKTAMNTLSVLQTCPEVKDWVVPDFNQKLMQHELDEFKFWFLDRYLKRSCSQRDQNMLHTTFTQLIETASEQEQVFMHRDYHSANLLVLPSTKDEQEQTGVLDFQDACKGPITYDLVSLLRDCYIHWPEEKVTQWVSYYYEIVREQNPRIKHVSLEKWMQWFDWMGMQRHMKAIFIFARKHLRDHTTNYLQHIPRTLQYVVSVSGRYPEFQTFHAYMKEIAGLDLCAQ